MPLFIFGLTFARARPLIWPQLKQRTHRDPHSNVHAQRAERVMCKVKQVPETKSNVNKNNT